jgi:tetratricopeptide (TPR) repeat protein
MEQQWRHGTHVMGAPEQTPRLRPPHGWVFDGFRLDRRDERLWRGHEILPLHSKSFAVLCCLLTQAGRLVTKDQILEAVWPETAVSEERGHQAYALRLLGDIAARREPPESALAEAYYRQALALVDELGMRPLQAHCYLGLGTLYAKIDQREQACTELSAAIDLYRAMDMTFWLPQTEAALAQVAK